MHNMKWVMIAGSPNTDYYRSDVLQSPLQSCNFICQFDIPFIFNTKVVIQTNGSGTLATHVRIALMEMWYD